MLILISIGKDEYLSSYAVIRSWTRAQDYQIANVENWFASNPGAISLAEQQFIKTGGDVVPLVFRNRSLLHRLLERYEPMLKFRLFRRQPRPDQSVSKSIYYYSHTRVEITVSATIIVVGVILLLAPMWALHFVTSDLARLGVITAFIVIFTALVGATTLAKPFEVLAGTAA